MAKCSNCGATLSCGCQRKVVNGISGCNKCLANAPKKTIQRTQPTTTPTPVPNKWGKDRYNNLTKFTK
jgi:hypothetical protein